MEEGSPPASPDPVQPPISDKEVSFLMIADKRPERTDE